MSEPTSNLIKADGEEVFNAALKAFTEALTGIAASDKKDWALSFGYLLQRVRGGKFLKTLSDEWAKYRKKGRIKDDYLATEQGQACLQEILDSLDKESPDEQKFSAMKRILITAAEEKLSDRRSILPQQLMRICRGLSSGELVLLATAYGVFKRGEMIKEAGVPGDRNQWVTLAVEKSGLQFRELVESHDESLTAKRLFSPQVVGSSSFSFTKFIRLSDLGHCLCEFIHAPTEEDKSK